MDWERTVSAESSETELNESMLEADEIWVRVDGNGYEKVENPSEEWREIASYQASEILERTRNTPSYTENIFHTKTSEGEEYSIKCLS